MKFDFGPLVLTFQLAFATTAILVAAGIPLAYWLAVSRRSWKSLIEPLVSMPLILPPTVLGFYLLLLFSPSTGVGRFLENVVHVRIPFTFLGLVIGSVLFSLPFMVNPLKAGFQNFPSSLREAAYTLGKTEKETLFKVILPNIKPALWTGIVMSFAHTIGEFGVVLMIGGNIPGETRVASIAIFNEVEALKYAEAHIYSGILIMISFSILFALNLVNKRGQ
ncbi:MAG TPA: molybdate ABC transporter permease subunit [Candidatus Omnitrophica bacterium]|nr:MAG: molybdenum ABC transporter permease subunit [Omnitrophica WOR_2 bacterium GWA2_45_18]HBR14139.1 molybdate ABC transporter permease subunit [Candidatus Omnitrophota bacterium]